MRHMRSKSAAEVSRARRDVKNQFPARGGQLRDDPLQAPGGKPLIGERNGLGTKLCTHQVIMRTGHTGYVRQLPHRADHRLSRPERVSADYER